MSSALTSLIGAVQHLSGPHVIVGRPHSGTRSVASMFMKNEIFMGSEVVDDFLDSEIWYCRFVLPLIASPPCLNADIHHAAPEVRKFRNERLKDTLKWFFISGPPSTGAWGWKLSETLFLMPLLQYYFPSVRFVHVIRDGRDVSLSDDGYFQLTSLARMSGFKPLEKVKKAVTLIRNGHQRYARRYNYGTFCNQITFGEPDITHWKGIDLCDRGSLARNRFLIQMQSWRHCVETARRYGATMPANYIEVRYEDFCAHPLREAERLFDFLELPLQEQTRHHLTSRVNAGRIGKWRTRHFNAVERADFDAALAHGRELLRTLNYVV